MGNPWVRLPSIHHKGTPTYPWHPQEWETHKGFLLRKKKRKEYKIWCNKERKRYEKMEEEKISRIKTEEEVWKYQ